MDDDVIARSGTPALPVSVMRSISRNLPIALAVAAVLVLGHALNGTVGVKGRGPVTPQEFWMAVPPGHAYERYSSTSEMAEAVDAVVLGHIETIEPGRNLVADSESGEIAAYATLIVAIEEELRGVVHSEVPGTIKVELFLDDPSAYDRIAEAVSQESAVWFLRNKAEEAAKLGLPAEYPGAGEFYYRVASGEGVFRVVDGMVMSVSAERDGWVSALDGTPVEALLEQLRSR